MNLKARLYLVAVVLLAIAAVGLTYWHGSWQSGLSSRDWTGLVWCVAIGILAERLSIGFSFGSGQAAQSSLAFLPFLSAIILFPVPAAVLAIAIVCAVSNFLLRRTPLLKGLFNVAQGALAGFVAGFAFKLIAGPGALDGHYLRFAVGFAFLAALFFLSNMILSSVAVALLRGERTLEVFSAMVGPGGTNLLYDLLASPIAVVPIVLYKDSIATGMFLIVFPLLLMRHSYLSKLELIQTNKDLLKALVTAIETRDPYTSGHSLRVEKLAQAIAIDLGLTGKTLRNVETAALLHDIGKIDPIYAAVLSKPFDLNAEERALIQTHAARGADMLSVMSSVHPDIVLAVRHHHERYDGNGYPDGLSGRDIPLAARIIMLCDSIDAMLSDRPYRRALSVPQVRAELIRCSGTQFDPEITRVVLAMNTLERAVHLISQEDTPASERRLSVVTG